MPGIAWFLLDFFIVLVIALLISHLIDIEIFIHLILSVPLIIFCIQVLTFEIGALLGYLSNIDYFFLFHIGLFSMVLIIFFKNSGRNISLNKNIKDIKTSIYIVYKKILKRPLVFIALLLTLFSFLTFIIFNLKFPQYVDDVLTTYLARIGYWLQYGSIEPWPADTYQLSQVIYPINGQILIHWSMLFTRSEIFASLPQLIFLFLSIISIYGVSRNLGANRIWSLIAALLTFCLPNIIFQGTFALTDMISSGLFIMSIYFLFESLKRNDSISILFSSISLGLAIGTKQTIFFLLPSLTLFMITLFFINGGGYRKIVIKWVCLLIVCICLFGSFAYFNNFNHFGNFLGPQKTFSGFTMRENIITADFIQRAFSNIKYLILENAHLYREYKIDTLVNIQPGILFMIYSLSILIYEVINLIHHKFDFFRIGLIIFGITNLMIVLLIRDFTSAISRYMIPTIFCFMPLLAKSLDEINENK